MKKANMIEMIEMMNRDIENTGNDDIIDEWYHLAYGETALNTDNEYWFNEAVNLYNELMAEAKAA